MSSVLSSTTTIASDAAESLQSLHTQNILQLPSTLLDTLVPGYSLVAKFFLQQLGIDISIYVSFLAIGIAVLTAANYAISPVIDFFLSSACSSVTILEWTSLYDEVLFWVSTQSNLQNLRSLRGRSPGQEVYYDDDDDEQVLESGPTYDIPEGAIFNFTQWSSRIPPLYEPHESSGWFWYKGYLFKISRDNDSIAGEYSNVTREREKLTIRVLWRSAKPIKDLIDNAREQWMSRHSASTKIRRPAPKEQRSSSSGWRTIAMRPTRSMSTVVLDDVQKYAILTDINDFLLPKTARWYSNRGIPYRRGYLFHGPPGTGKSSLSFSLAGLFGLDIYCLSLTEITLTEEDLILLFNTLPKRCVVLLEDIDCAGVSRPDPNKKKSRRKKKSKKSKKEDDSSDAESVAGPKTPRLRNAITISGLLNAIDGVSSQEGRVLIMTTNYPEKLDDALVRPGRVDLKIDFKLASRQQTRELFVRMFSPDMDEVSKQPTKLEEVLSKPRTSAGNGHSRQVSTASSVTIVDEDVDVDALADEFADSVPDEVFSPAELQGYLLVHKRSPRQAVAGVAKWRDEKLAEQKAKEDKVKEPKVSEIAQKPAEPVSTEPKKSTSKPVKKSKDGDKDIKSKEKGQEKTGSESEYDSSGTGSDSDENGSGSSSDGD